MKMTNEQMRELDKFCAEHIMGYLDDEDYPEKFWKWSKDRECQELKYSPTTDASAAMGVLKKCAEYAQSLEFGYDESEGWWIMKVTPLETYHSSSHESFELAICKFAKSLYSK